MHLRGKNYEVMIKIVHNCSNHKVHTPALSSVWLKDFFFSPPIKANWCSKNKFSYGVLIKLCPFCFLRLGHQPSVFPLLSNLISLIAHPSFSILRRNVRVFFHRKSYLRKIKTLNLKKKNYLKRFSEKTFF